MDAGLLSSMLQNLPCRVKRGLGVGLCIRLERVCRHHHQAGAAADVVRNVCMRNEDMHACEEMTMAAQLRDKILGGLGYKVSLHLAFAGLHFTT